MGFTIEGPLMVQRCIPLKGETKLFEYSKTFGKSTKMFANSSGLCKCSDI